MAYGLTQTAAPATEPVTQAEAKAHLRVTHSLEDDLIDGMIAAARILCEVHTNRQFVTATYAMTLDKFPDVIRMPKPALLTVPSIAYIDTAGDTQTLTIAASEYNVDITRIVGRVAPLYGEVWPSTRSDINAVTVAFTAGYGAAAAVPDNVKSAILMTVADVYLHRSKGTELRVIENSTVKALLAAATVLEAA